MNFGSILCVAFTAILALTANANHATLVSLLLSNAVAQVGLFTVVACIPFWRTGRMSYVDIAWPFGVATIGLMILLLGDGHPLRKLAIAGVYVLIGLRMGMGAVLMGRATGVIFKTEFPRYEYRKMVLQGSHPDKVRLHMLTEILAQACANMSVLALPGFMLALNPSPVLSAWEIAGIATWAAAYVLESTADAQKLRYIAKNKGGVGVCEVGLWKYSRHPNYFAEWLVWTGIVIAAVPSWLALRESESLLIWLTLGLGALGASAMMYTTLVYLTGAVPAEYYSVRKRPEYTAYQQRTNMFFPWFPQQRSEQSAKDR